MSEFTAMSEITRISPMPGDKNFTRLLIITSEIWKEWVILPKALVL